MLQTLCIPIIWSQIARYRWRRKSSALHEMCSQHSCWSLAMLVMSMEIDSTRAHFPPHQAEPQWPSRVRQRCENKVGRYDRIELRFFLSYGSSFRKVTVLYSLVCFGNTKLGSRNVHEVIGEYVALCLFERQSVKRNSPRQTPHPSPPARDARSHPRSARKSNPLSLSRSRATVNRSLRYVRYE